MRWVAVLSSDLFVIHSVSVGEAGLCEAAFSKQFLGRVKMCTKRVLIVGITRKHHLAAQSAKLFQHSRGGIGGGTVATVDGPRVDLKDGTVMKL